MSLGQNARHLLSVVLVPGALIAVGCGSTATKIADIPSLASRLAASQDLLTFEVNGINSSATQMAPKESTENSVLSGWVDPAHEAADITETDKGSQSLGTVRHITIGTQAWLLEEIGRWVNLGPVNISAHQDYIAPAVCLEAMKAHPGQFVADGTNKIGGIEAAHYTATLDLLDEPAATKSVLDVWIDSSGLIRQLKQVVYLPDPSIPPQPGLIFTTLDDYSEYGTVLHIEAPPAG